MVVEVKASAGGDTTVNVSCGDQTVFVPAPEESEERSVRDDPGAVRKQKPDRGDDHLSGKWRKLLAQTWRWIWRVGLPALATLISCSSSDKK